MSLFGKLWDREPGRAVKLNHLLVEYGNAQFDCGMFDFDGDDPNHNEYLALCAKADKAKQAVIDYVRELRSSPLPQGERDA